MCEHDESIGERHQVVANADAATALRDAYIIELIELVRAKSGNDAEAVALPRGMIGIRVLEARAFGVAPDWCHAGRKLDRADPRRLGMRFESTARDDGLIDCKATIYQLTHAPE